MIVRISEETKGYRVYLPKYRMVVTTQHVKNIETLGRTQNEQVQRMYLQEDDSADENESSGNDARGAETADAESATAGNRRKKKGKTRANEKPRQREQHMRRSATREAAGGADGSARQEEPDAATVNNGLIPTPRTTARPCGALTETGGSRPCRRS
ncbi:unnamed protein product [Phytophthora fragariaefolia]|uniref:Unnamed protein product n=1 Tax=Phytophthora fragariaefolia TaxID=1490495 RepID=A0A9W6YAR3_9STRA|nr:unnamed protein product [Phytophthora fragariaefolia]